MKVLVLVASKKKRVEHLSLLLKHASPGDTTYDTGSLEELTFTVGDGEAAIYNQNGTDISSYDLVVFRLVGKRKSEAVTVAAYCRARGVKYIDSMIGEVAAIDDENKLAEMFALDLAGISVPATVYGASEYLIAQSDTIGFPAVLKAADGKKGRNNYLVSTKQEIADILDTYPKSKMLLQRFIPNDQDYRVLSLNYKRVVVTLRKRKSDTTHLNNVSAGGEEQLVEDHTKLGDVIELSTRAARALKIEVAGVDVVVDRNTGKPYIMEVNRAPEFTLDAEFKGYFDAIEEVFLP